MAANLGRAERRSPLPGQPSVGGASNQPPCTQILLRPKPALMAILKTVGVTSEQLTRAEILDGLRRYIKMKSLYNQEKPFLIECEGDDLEKVFGVKQFHVSRVLSFVSQLTEFASRRPNISSTTSDSGQYDVVDGPRTFIQRPSEMSGATPGSSYGATADAGRGRKRGRKSSGETSPVQRRRRRRRCPSSISIVSSDNEGPWTIQVVEIPSDASSERLSVQSKETMLVKSSSDTMLTDNDLAIIDWDDEDDDAPFAIEYEVRSQSSSNYEDDDDDDYSSSDESSHRQEILVVCTDSDVEFFADYSESEDDESDPEIASDKWICGFCGDLNSPLSRYCLCCWKERAGWMPEKPVRKFRRSLSAPSGLQSSSSSSSPTGGAQESMSQPLAMTEPILPETRSEPVHETFQTPSPIIPPPTTNSLHRHLLNSIVSKRSASDAQSNQSFDSAFKSGSQDSELSIVETPTFSLPSPSSSIPSDLLGSQESGIFDKSNYLLDITASSASPEFVHPEGLYVTSRTESSIPYDDVDGPIKKQNLVLKNYADKSRTESLIPYDDVDGPVKKQNPVLKTDNKESSVDLLSRKDLDYLDLVVPPRQKPAETVSKAPTETLPSESSVPELHPSTTVTDFRLKTVSTFSEPESRMGANVSNADFTSVSKLPELGSRTSAIVSHAVPKHPEPASKTRRKVSEATVTKPENPSTSESCAKPPKVSEAGQCPFCVKQSSNAVLIHGKTGHQVCCYKCARKLRRRGKPCPVCRKPIQKVIKNFII